MSRQAKISVLGLYQWSNDLFSLMNIPEGLELDIFVNNLLSETCELEVLYPNPEVMKVLIGSWSAKCLPVWEHLYETTQYEYNPIENYNRYETGSEDGTGRTTHSGTDTSADTTTYGGTDRRTEAITQGGTEGETTTAQMAQGGQDVVTGSDTKGHWVAGFNPTPSGQDDGLVKQTRDQDDATTTTAYGKTESDNGSRTTTFGKTENVTENKTYGQAIQKTGNVTHGEQIATTNEGSHNIHAHGNIGVTTTQKLIREQRDIELFNPYDIIIEDFKMRFCILVY